MPTATTTRDALARAWHEPAPFDLRVNTGKTTREEALAALASRRLRRRAHAVFAASASASAAGPRSRTIAWLADGRLEVQDEGSQLVGYALAPRRSDMVVDFCAGAGGKTLLLGALMRSQGRLYAFDVAARPPRQAHAAPRALRICRTCIRR